MFYLKTELPFDSVTDWFISVAINIIFNWFFDTLKFHFNQFTDSLRLQQTWNTHFGVFLKNLTVSSIDFNQINVTFITVIFGINITVYEQKLIKFWRFGDFSQTVFKDWLEMKQNLQRCKPIS